MGDVSSACGFSIGQEWSTESCNRSGEFDGLIDEVRVSNVVRTADWILTEFKNQKTPSSFHSLDPEENAPYVQIQVTVSDTASDGSGATTIVPPAPTTTTIDSSTTPISPFPLAIGNDPDGQTFTSTNVRRLRVQINVTAVNGGGSFTLAYDGACGSNQCSKLDTPALTVPEYAIGFVAAAVLIPTVAGGLWRKRRSTDRAVAAPEDENKEE